jgi:hypothetical protein
MSTNNLLCHLLRAGFVNPKDNSFPKQLFAYCVDGIASEWCAGWLCCR